MVLEASRRFVKVSNFLFKRPIELFISYKKWQVKLQVCDVSTVLRGQQDTA